MTLVGLRHPSTVAFAAMLGTALMALYMVASLKQELVVERSRHAVAVRTVFVPVPAWTVPLPLPSSSPLATDTVPARMIRPVTPSPSPSRSSLPSPSPTRSVVPSPKPSGPSPLLRVDVDLREVLYPWLKT